MTRYAAMIGIMAWALLAGSAQAVGLGDITLRSALTEPLDAEIRIVNPEDLTASELNVSLANADDFRRAGVERPFFLTSLQFAVREDGDAFVVNVTSEQPVQEPFLDFLVELSWPSGRLIREYTLLLDPPMFAPDDGGMAQVFPGADPFDSDEPAVPDVEPLSQPTPAQQARRVEELPDSQYRVENNDTLWEIALRARQDSSQSPQQVMLAIQDLNPDAFINGNINRVRAGQLLDLPSAEQVAVRTAAEANREVERQNSGLRGTPPAADAQLSASDETATGLSGAAEARDPDGFLEVITDASAEADPAGGATGDSSGEATQEVARLQNELTMQQELNDELRLQYDDQQARLSELEEQVQMLSRLVELQSESAAQLQAAADELARAQEATPSEVAQGDNGVATADTVPTADEAGESTASEPAAVVPPATNLDVRPQQDMLTRLVGWSTQSYNAALILLALVLVLAATNLFIKRRQAAAADAELELDEDLLAEEADPLDVADEEWSGLDDGETEGSKQPLNEALNTAALAGGAAAAAEAIENAELYMAFQRYEEAESALETALEQSPGETSLQLKLLEVYAETGQTSQFEKLAGNFGGDPEAISGLRQQLANSAVTNDFSDSLNSDEDDEFADLDLSFGDDEDEEEDISLHETGGYKSGRDDDLGSEDSGAMDFDVPELDDQLQDGTADGDKSWHGADDLTSDGLDFDPEPSPKPAKAEAPASIDDERMMDFDLSDSELTTEPTLPAAAEDDTGSEAFDLDFDLDDLDDDLNTAGSEDRFSRESDGAVDFESELAGLSDELGLDDDLADDLDLSDYGDGDDAPLADTGKTVDVDPALSDAMDQADDELAADLDSIEADEESVEGMNLPPLAGEAEDDWDDDFDFLEGSDEVATKLDLARAYIDMEDPEGARDILSEVIEEGDAQQQADAKSLLGSLT